MWIIANVYAGEFVFLSAEFGLIIEFNPQASGMTFLVDRSSFYLSDYCGYTQMPDVVIRLLLFCLAIKMFVESLSKELPVPDLVHFGL